MLHAVVSLTGAILGYLLTSAAPYDNQPLTELLDSMPHHLQDLLGDGAYNDEPLQAFLAQYRGLILQAPTKVTAHSVGVVVNLSLGRPALRLAELGV